MENNFEENNGNETRITTKGGYEVGDYRIEIPIEGAEQEVKDNFRDFSIESFISLSEGMGNAVFLANDSTVFRFPKHEKASRSLEKEIVMLPKLKENLSVSIPDFKFIGTRKKENLKFVGYEKIEGVPLTKELLENQLPERKTLLAKDIADFFNQLHTFDINEAKGYGIEEKDFKEMFQGLLIDAREYVYPVLKERLPDEAAAMEDKIENVFNNYLSNEKNFEYDPKLLHGDLEAEHILMNAQTHHVSGILDFGGLQIGDPDYDLWRPFYHYGKEFTKELLRYYPHQNEKLIFEKMDFFWTAQTIHRALRPILLGDQESVKDIALPNLKSRLLETESDN